MSKLTKKQNGVAAIEFVLLLPLLLLIGWVSVDFGRLIFQYDALTKTTRDATRYLAAVTRPPNTPDSESYKNYVSTDETSAKNLALCGSISNCTNTIVPELILDNIAIDYSNNGEGIYFVKVSIINYKVKFITNQIAQLIGMKEVNLNDISVTMRQIQQ